jgi:adhesin transport system outer membrane protein
LIDQRSAVTSLVDSYSEQFKVGERSLLDLLDTQNTRFRIQVAIATTDAAAQFADYRILAASGMLLQTLGVEQPSSAEPYARQQADVPETPPAETMPRHSPQRENPWGLY